jgi:hypothetical protein
MTAGTTRLAAITASLALAAGIAACGGDDDEEATPAGEETASAEEVIVTADDPSATEKTFDLSATPTAETQTVRFENAGDEPHELIFARINEGFTTQEAIELQGEKGSAELIGTSEGPIKPGDTAEFPVRKPLQPGPYAMLCALGSPEGPHFELGQLEEFEIQ